MCRTVTMAWLMTTWHKKATVRPNYVVLLAEVTSVLTSRASFAKESGSLGYGSARSATTTVAVWDNVGAQTQNSEGNCTRPLQLVGRTNRCRSIGSSLVWQVVPWIARCNQSLVCLFVRKEIVRSPSHRSLLVRCKNQSVHGSTRRFCSLFRIVVSRQRQGKGQSQSSSIFALSTYPQSAGNRLGNVSLTRCGSLFCKLARHDVTLAGPTQRKGKRMHWLVRFKLTQQR
jgi:hypothetical protein